MYQGKYLSGAKPPKATKQPEKEQALTEDVVLDEIPETVQEVPAPKKQKAPKQKKRVRVGSIIFYFLYLCMIAAAAYGIHYGYGLLEDWLIRFEASQPDTKSQEFFQELFADPDWGQIYDMAGLEGTEFEGKKAYVTYMEQLVGDSELTYSKTSAGLSGGQKYIVKLGEEKVATFTIQNHVTGELEIPDWKLDTVEAGFFTRNEDVTVVTKMGRTITLNGVPLDESYVVKTTSTAVDSYLPEGVYGPSTSTVYASGFLVAPEVAAIDENGEVVELDYDEATNTYYETVLDAPAAEISDEEYNALLNATTSYSKAMIAADKYDWRNHFVKNTEIYEYIRKLIANDSHFDGWTRYEFEQETISEYHRYTDTLFSARIEVTLNTYRGDGSVKPFELNTTIFMEKSDSGKWLVTNMTNVELHEVLTQVRLTWTQNGEVLSTGMVDASEKLLTPPAVTVPEGKEFVGWFLETTDDEGSKTLSLVFAPTETGTISLPSDYTLEPMVLQARFEAKGE